MSEQNNGGTGESSGESSTLSGSEQIAGMFDAAGQGMSDAVSTMDISGASNADVSSGESSSDGDGNSADGDGVDGDSGDGGDGDGDGGGSGDGGESGGDGGDGE